MEDDEFNPYTPPESAVSPVASTDSIAKALEGTVYPLHLSFKILTLVRQATMKDGNEVEILYTRQKFFKLKEHVELFTDKSRSTRLADIRANKMLDWSARYGFTDTNNGEIGSVGRKGWRSLWKATYEVFPPGGEALSFTISEENPLAKFFDGLFGQIPIIGALSSYLFHPRYSAVRPDGEKVMLLEKRPAFWEGKFRITKLAELEPREEMALLLSFLMLLLLERSRG